MPRPSPFWRGILQVPSYALPLWIGQIDMFSTMKCYAISETGLGHWMSDRGGVDVCIWTSWDRHLQMTRRKNNVIMTSKRRSDVVMALWLRRVPVGLGTLSDIIFDWSFMLFNEKRFGSGHYQNKRWLLWQSGMVWLPCDETSAEWLVTAEIDKAAGL